VECCIEPIIEKNYTYIVEPEESILTQKGLLIAHSIIDINTNQTSTLIANITDETYTRRNFNKSRIYRKSMQHQRQTE
jgi:hypothetical protein